MAGAGKEEIITFKVDHALADELKRIPNRSEFIRQAVLQALANECPLCHGTGTLTPNQLRHWHEFLSGHSLHTCDDCHETYLACDQRENDARQNQ